VLLSSAVGSFAQGDEFGSRACNPMELYHNQVTRVQGRFSLRLHHRSFGLLMLQATVNAPCTVLDFPTRAGVVAELKATRYDVIGIGGIIPNAGKVVEMCRLARLHQPWAQIVIGGHIANLPDLAERASCDHVVRGEGVRWLRTYLGQDPAAPVKHPAVLSAFGLRALGMTPPDGKGDTAAILVPSVGRPVGCNFCPTSAMFGGKGGGIHAYPTGDALYEVMSRLERELATEPFFVLDESFLLHRQRALRLLELLERDGKAWSLMVFSSARVLQSYGSERLVRLGVSWVWMGLEGEDSHYQKLRGIDTKALVRELQAHGIRVLGSTTIGLEHHKAANLPEVIDFAVSHATDFHQFMLHTPIPGTALHKEIGDQGRLLPESACSLADSHGQARFNYRHPHLQPGSEGAWLLHALRRDFAVSGPSLGRLYRTTLDG
jgi:radical SAM superfamily enzyme YgiQ (UPF0313 family)